MEYGPLIGVFLAILVLVLCSILVIGGILLFLYPEIQEEGGIFDIPDNEIIPEDEDTSEWSQITKSSVEKGCLQRGKQIAEDEGYSEFAVWSCNCNAEESEETKSYICTLNAIDGNHPFEMICYKSTSSCSITSGSETEEYTFEEIKEFLNN